MGLRTFGVGRKPSSTPVSLYNANIDVGEGITYPGGERPNGANIYPRAGDQSLIDTADSVDNDLVEGDPVLPPPPIAQNIVQAKPTPPLKVDTPVFDWKTYDEKRTKEKNEMNAYRAGAAALTAIGGVINAQSRYTQVKGQNNFNIQMADNQLLQVASETSALQLREDVKGRSRGESAVLDAVAQGQSANGDLANTAKSNEAVYAAQNIMALQINSMREIFGIQSKIRQIQASNTSARINRDQEFIQAGVQGLSSFVGGYQPT